MSSVEPCFVTRICVSERASSAPEPFARFTAETRMLGCSQVPIRTEPFTFWSRSRVMPLPS